VSRWCGVRVLTLDTMQASSIRAEALQRENQTLRSQISMLTEQLQAAPASGEGVEAALDGKARRATSPAGTPGLIASSRLYLSGSSGQSTGDVEFSGHLGGRGMIDERAVDGPVMPALRTSDSMDGRSAKSDNLTGDEMEVLGHGGMRLVSASSVSGSGRDISPMKSPIKSSASASQKLARCACCRGARAALERVRMHE
jgi:hypothetical protein